MTSLPILGAAMTLDDLEIHRDWLFERQRDLELQSFAEANVLNGDWSPLASRARKLLDGHKGRLGIHGPFWGFTIASQDPDIRSVISKRLLQGLEVCASVGATHMVVHSPYTTWSYNNLDNNPGEREKITEYCHLTLRDAVKRAEDIGCTMVLENNEDKDPHIRVALADSFKSPAVAVSIDTGHAYYAHGSTGAPPVDYFVHAAGNRLQHVHLQDADGYADRHWSLGEGTIQWRSVFAALARLESNPRLIIEIRDKSRIPASAAYIASLGIAE
ncbi:MULTISPECIES: sugar phosphate isomerase/epimerase family protein [unclassified Mesorhizobium]|uniref:sugar phosphate isomerase/epimerase family protein n=1 Tax=unclassified Mesorhizobium TaxID=325217 RepID=UPI001093D4A1|nr:MULTISPECIES: sugar phosphate isomerase/epimerase family protein [unclassified Mesorhizobium]TGT84517.1 sugar phosphate isomerase/epimerase [Mesorhizobium sp. M8A.F.Ca.ET.161.01.1.1]TGV38029.1 sugar phosphate isomerase/epimerase [Mesorhizobium sp. M8A.F.Ca.ET.142.01.1.1]TGV83466.1 sugar phosphate isomerase/epimerase [Mesorhizobium sp. M00.F.Ca.ET.158.01.1.1]